jgi:hypothetical protein
VGDTGASSHCFKKSNIEKHTKITQENIIVKSAKAGSTLEPIGRANIGTTYHDTLIFNDDDLEKELISIPRLDDEGCKIIIENGKMDILKDNKRIMYGTKEKGLYMFNLHKTENLLLADNAPKDKTEILQRAHTKLGHRNLLQIKKYIKNKQINFAPFPVNISDQEIKALPLCDACQRAKFTTRRMRGRGNREASRVGQKLVTDMKGPIRVKGLQGQTYYQGVLDVRSKYLFHFCFERKSAAFENLKTILEKPLYREKLENYHSDGALELLSKNIVNMLKERGITNTYSAPYKHSDNSIIERSHRTVFEMAHTILLHAHLSISFWCEAVDHAVYLYNRLPTLTGEGYMAPITAAFGTLVNLTHEHIFGCICYFNIPAETREKGFVDKAHKGIYLGH